MKEEQKIDESTIHQTMDEQSAQTVASEEEVETVDSAESQAEEDEKVQNEELIKLREQVADLKDKNLRMMAEFENYRRRTNKEKLDLIKTAGEDILKDILPLIDDFERAIDAMKKTDDIDALRQGIDLTYQKFISFLSKHEVKVIETENADFDTNFHEAITTFPAPTEELKGKVIDCTQKGYMLEDKVIRYAKVVVGE